MNKSKVYTANPKHPDKGAPTHLQKSKESNPKHSDKGASSDMMPIYTVIGLMSGTSMDGVDAALIRTDGYRMIERLDYRAIAYPALFRQQIEACLNNDDDPTGLIAETAHALTMVHVNAVKQLGEADLIGFHGQSIWHKPAVGLTRQIGNAPLMANLTGIPVVHDFRSADMAAGGQGAPLIPVYHRALVAAAGLPTPIAIVNLGGVGNVTYIGSDDQMMAFDTGPGNALIDDWVRHKTHNQLHYDSDGLYGLAGNVDEKRVKQWLSHDYFAQTPPKSLDRNAFACDISDLSLRDGAATLAAFTVQSVMVSTVHFPEAPQAWVITGGGRHNQAIMQQLQQQTNAPVHNADDVNMDGDGMEAEGFAYMAVRSVLGLPISFPSTTGCPASMTGGVLVEPSDR